MEKVEVELAATQQSLSHHYALVHAQGSDIVWNLLRSDSLAALYNLSFEFVLTGNHCTDRFMMLRQACHYH